MEEVILKHSLINAIEHNGKAEIQSVLGRIIAEDPRMRKKIRNIAPEIKKTVDEINSLTLDEQKKQLDGLGVRIKKKEVVETLLPELPNAVKGKVMMRLAPFPSGPLHIGNARMVVLNDEYAKRYKGKLFLIIDDTIGSEEKAILPEAYKLIFDGLKWLGVKYYKILYKSGRLKLYYGFIKELIEKNLAYVCECNVEDLRKNRFEGIACKHRNQNEKVNLKKWGRMLKGGYKEGGVVVRLKTDIKHPNPAFRDRVLARVVNRRHPKVGRKYRVWPMLEVSWALDDHLLGITHVIRGKELMIEDMMEEFVWEKMKWKTPEIIHYGILNLERVKLSKTKARHAIEKKEYSGWDDPRTWSLQSLRKRGIQPEAIRSFIKKMGLSLADVTVPLEILYAENRKIIDPIANRYFAVLDPVMISVKASAKLARADLHPDFRKRGKRRIPVNSGKIYVERGDFDSFHGKEVGLMNLFSVSLERNSELTSKEVRYEIPKIHWVSEPNIKIKVIMPDGSVKSGVAEPSIKKVKINQIIQMPRVGFASVSKVGKEMLLYFTHK